MNEVIQISNLQLFFALFLVATSGICSFLLKLELGRDLFFGTLRSVVQLTMLGYVLTLIFNYPSGLISVSIYCLMIVFAARIIIERIREKEVPFVLPAFFSMLISYLLITILVTGVIVGAKPWWRPDYFLPIGGMIIGNSMTALSLSLERLFSDLRNQRRQIEILLCLGATPFEASQQILRDAIKAGMIPSINSMMGVGVVFIPGMMTGQVLAGVDPLIAVRYQIVVMLMLTASTALGSVMVVFLAARRCFNSNGSLVFSLDKQGFSVR